jgi:hypothetical protein
LLTENPLLVRRCLLHCCNLQAHPRRDGENGSEQSAGRSRSPGTMLVKVPVSMTRARKVVNESFGSFDGERIDGFGRALDARNLSASRNQACFVNRVFHPTNARRRIGALMCSHDRCLMATLAVHIWRCFSRSFLLTSSAVGLRISDSLSTLLLPLWGPQTLC